MTASFAIGYSIVNAKYLTKANAATNTEQSNKRLKAK
jgi:hypothetical protein